MIEVSMATFPMNDQARVTGVKHATIKEFEHLLRENLGLSRQAAEALRAGGFKALREYLGSGQSGESNDDAAIDVDGLRQIIATMRS